MIWMFEGHAVHSVLRSMTALKRKMTKSDRARINARFAHRQANRKVKRAAWICWDTVWEVCFLQKACSTSFFLQIEGPAAPRTTTPRRGMQTALHRGREVEICHHQLHLLTISA